ncbi:MAG: CRISPR-associated endoribonuclease Cas2 [Ignavibacteria bacterium]|nr:CRISPR-associated endoribonuclease Cas2 [Ignavibacteria bacterium]
MYYIAVYDIASPGRLRRALKIFRKYMHWIQNSAFEGELNEGQYSKLKEEIGKIIKKKEDSLIFFRAENKKYINKTLIGIEKNEASMVF